MGRSSVRRWRRGTTRRPSSGDGAVEDEAGHADPDQGDDDVGDAAGVVLVPDEEADADAAEQHLGGDDGQPAHADADPQAGEDVGRGRRHQDAGRSIRAATAAAPGRHCGSREGMFRTPTAVLMMIGQIEVMKITNRADGCAWWKAARLIGSQASGGTVRSTWKIGSSAAVRPAVGADQHAERDAADRRQRIAQRHAG